MSKITSFFSLFKLTVPFIILTTSSISTAATTEESVFGYHPAGIFEDGYQNNGYEDAEFIGIKWTRQATPAYWSIVQPDIEKEEYDFEFHDEQWGSVPVSISIMGDLAPGKDRTVENSWQPIDEDAYVAFVKTTVERYDGDGIDDMPGLKNPIKYWQVCNEFGDSDWSDFADLQRITYLAIKEACSECYVLFAGIQSLSYDYMPRFEEKYGPVIKELNGKYLDIIDFHWYEEGNGGYKLKDNTSGNDILDYIRNYFTESGFSENIPIWSTEMGTYSGEPEGLPYQTEHEQAIDNFKRYIYGLSRGISKIFQSYGLMEGWHDEDTIFDHTGLIYEGKNSDDLGLGVKKLGYYSYKKMTEMLTNANFSTLEMVHDGTQSDLVYVFKVEKENEPLYIAWWDYFDDPTYSSRARKRVNINGFDGRYVTITKVVPDFEYGKEVDDYHSAFTVNTRRVQRGNVRISLDETPIFITISNN
ncbi:MAG: hypothetical protein FJ264_00535 [Planctomycetes bacterium]|nr:hypothetical protein [Planctomycetota bacterium]